ncbi:manganese/iron ABC transporter ATP-binding protein [Pseudooceanicola sediminis]|uniref:Manganese/iron ABC transporter ATP-binding protein n=1 Tax=Pseudooceanicola sediminis TaxID=2211117 RepID=A0A399J0H7_9RHOB|nr:manganese/iron ABC transporter ATP-binding protein [Puniceibacterium sp. HSS470]RII38039.1 manganese/iron ABC transporter ATP-binding protein [Pseudooceanicola sediminis]|tara:strand:- start:10 stop:1134 length:1125 start_codon:yes stop_codon:yes gene_type:complete
MPPETARTSPTGTSPTGTAPLDAASRTTAPHDGPQDAPQNAGISARNVTVTYRNGLTALRDASFEIPRGTITALVGVNGAGKSTLFKAIMGFVPAARGDIQLLGLTVKQALKANLVAYVPQSEDVDWAFPVLVEDVVMMGRYGHMGFLRRPRPADHAAVTEALHRVNMTDFRTRQIGELSGGQKKRVFLARALAQNGQVILLDEPFTGVDVGTEEQIIALLRELRAEGRVMLVSTHNLGSVPEFCDRTVLIKGTVLAYGPTEDTFTHKNLAAAFGGVLRHFTLGGDVLHDDDDPRQVSIFTDDERPLVQYGDKMHRRDARPKVTPPTRPTRDASSTADDRAHRGEPPDIDTDTGANSDTTDRPTSTPAPKDPVR